MKDYETKGKITVAELEDGRTVKIDTKWIEDTMAALDTDREDVILMWLEDNDYLINEEMEELDAIAKANKPKMVAKAKVERKKREVVKKEDPEKEMVIKAIAEMLKGVAENVEITNTTKIIEFNIGENEYKLDLIRKRVKKGDK